MSSDRMRLFILLLVSVIPVARHAVLAQASGLVDSAAADIRVSLADLVERLPDYVEMKSSSAYTSATETANTSERDAAIPKLMPWIEDERPEVRRLALLTLYLVYLSSEARPGQDLRTSVPAQYVPAIAAHLRDPDLRVRKAAAAALLPTEYSGVGLDELVRLVAPMLHEPDVLTEYPDPFFMESDKQMLARMVPEQQAQFKARPRKVIKLPAEGVELLGLLTMPAVRPTNAVDDTILAFLGRNDQTKSTLGDCLHTLELNHASERVNNEALRLVFEKKAMTIFLLQFVTQLRLTPEQLTAQKAQLVVLSNDASAHPALRRSAAVVAACWTGQNNFCRPSERDLSEQLDTR